MRKKERKKERKREIEILFGLSGLNEVGQHGVQRYTRRRRKGKEAIGLFEKNLNETSQKWGEWERIQE